MSPSCAATRFRRILFCGALAFLFPFLLYVPALRFGLVILDDPSFVSSNPLVADGLRLSAVRDAFLAPVPAAPMYIPLLWISYMLDVSLFGNHPWAFHLTNILLHSSSSVLLFLLLRRLTSRFFPPGIRNPESGLLFPLILALLWSLHPLRVESVAWIAERKDCLAVFFCLLVLHAWLSALDARLLSRRILHAVSALVLYTLGLLSKPSLVPLPVFLALLSLLPDRPRPRFRPLAVSLLPFLLLSALSSFATAAFHARHAALPAPPLLARIATIPSVIVFYIAKTLIPRHLSVLYPQWTSPLWLGILLSIPFLLAAFWIFRQRRIAPLLFLGIAFAALFLLPVAGLVPVSFNLVADRYSLLPAIGLSMALLELAPSRFGTGMPRPLYLAPLLFSILVAAFAVGTSVYLPAWRDTASLFAPARRRLPDHFVIRGFDATQATQRGNFAASRECIARAAHIFPDVSLLLDDAANVFALDGPQATLDYLFAHLPPDSSISRWSFLVATVQLDLDRPSDALATVSAALATSPPSDPFRILLFQTAAVASHRLGDAPSALGFARRGNLVPPRTASLVPGHLARYYRFLWDANFKAPALRFFRDLAESDPTPSVLNNAAWILSTSFWSPAPPSEAVAYARRALDAVPSDSPLRPILLDTLSVALANASDYPAAIEAVSTAMALLPPSSPSFPAMRSRLALYRQSLPYRELLGTPVPPSEYACDFHL